MTTLQTTMTEIASMIDELGLDGKWEHFTVGKGNAPYHFWTVAPCGLYYAFRCMPSGHAGCKRAVEPTQQVTIHLKNHQPQG